MNLNHDFSIKSYKSLLFYRSFTYNKHSTKLNTELIKICQCHNDFLCTGYKNAEKYRQIRLYGLLYQDNKICSCFLLISFRDKATENIRRFKFNILNHVCCGTNMVQI